MASGRVQTELGHEGRGQRGEKERKRRERREKGCEDRSKPGDQEDKRNNSQNG